MRTARLLLGASARHKIAFALAFALIALMSGLAVGAGELEELKKEFGALDAAKAQALLAESRAREDKIRAALPRLREAEEKYVRAWKAREAHIRRYERITNELDRKNRALKEQQDKYRFQEQIARTVDAQNGLSTEQQQAEADRREQLYKQAMKPARDDVESLERSLYDLRDPVNEEWLKELRFSREYAIARNAAGVDDLKLPVYDSDRSSFLRTLQQRKPIDEELRALAERNRRLELLSKLGRALSDEPRPTEKPEPETEPAPPPPDKVQADEPPASADALAQEASQAIARTDLAAARALSDRLIDRVGEDDPRARAVSEQLQKVMEREAEAGQNIADARRYYGEARAMDLDGRPAEAAESYRVAMALLAQARAQTGSRDRADKIDRALGTVSDRLSDLPENAKGEDSHSEAPQREAGNRACAGEFPNAVMVRVNPAGGYFCQCRKGFAWNDGRTECVKAPDRRAQGRAACRKSFPNSVLVGFRNGLPQCNCPRGRLWNEARTACVQAPRTEASQGLDPRTAQAMYALGALIGQAIRSGGSRRQPVCHREPGGAWHCR